MGMDVGRKDTVVSEINVVPLIDVVLVLLIIFMVVTPLLLPKGVAVQLPEGRDPARKPDRAEDIVVSIRTDEALYITGEDKPLPRPEIERRLRQIADRAPSTPLFIQADRRLRYGVVKDAMLLCEGSGFRSISLVSKAAE